MQTLNQDIKNNDFKRVYLLFGEESFLKKSYKNRLREAITQGDTMNYNYYEGKGKTEEEAEQELKELTKVMEEQAKM